MSNKDPNVKIENGKVIFSKEILNLINSWYTNENKIWIDKYLSVLSDDSNINCTKFNVHHIIPAFLFKNENCKNRKSTQILADSLNENRIKLSISNHIKAHNYLRLIFPNNHNARMAVYISCGKINIENLTESEIDEIAKIIEDCSKENQTKEEKKEYIKNYNNINKEKISKQKREKYEETKEEKKEYNKNYYKENKEDILIQKKGYYINNKEIISEKKKEDRKINKEKISKQRKENYQNNREIILKRANDYDNAFCYDPIKKDACTRNALNIRKRHNKELYKNIIVSECLISEDEYTKIKEENLKLKKDISLQKSKEYYNLNRENVSKIHKIYYNENKNEINKKRKEQRNRLCYDPIKGDNCSFCALRYRKNAHKEEYKNINLNDCVIKN